MSKSRCAFCIIEDDTTHFGADEKMMLSANIISFALYQRVPWQVTTHVCSRHAMIGIRVVPKMEVLFALMEGKEPKPLDPELQRQAAALEIEVGDALEIVEDLKAKLDAAMGKGQRSDG